VEGITGHVFPVYLLGTSLPDNSRGDQTLTDHLYGGDNQYRFCQELPLGIGGVETLQKLGHHHIASYHINEGHSAPLDLALMEQHLDSRLLLSPIQEDLNAIQQNCVFTTHTPAPAGHDQFPLDMARSVTGEELLHCG